MRQIKNIIFIITAILISHIHSANAQFLPDQADFFWLYTDDHVAHFILEIGDNPDPQNTYIVLHGGYGGDHSYLINLVMPHTDTHRFVLYDQRGSLRTDAPDSTITYTNFVNDLEALRIELGLESVQLIAHSNGAMIALDYLGSYPDKVDKLVLLSPPLSFVHSDVFDSDELAEAIEYYRTSSEKLNREISERLERKLKQLGLYEREGLSGRELTNRSKVEFAGWNVIDITQWPKMQNAFYRMKVIELLNEHTTSEMWNERAVRQSRALAEAEIPIHVIIGESDFVDPDGKVWDVLIRDTQYGGLTVLQSASHMPWLDQPEGVQKLLYRIFE